MLNNNNKDFSLAFSEEIQDIGWTIATLAFLLIDFILFLSPMYYIYNKDRKNRKYKLTRQDSLVNIPPITIKNIFAVDGFEDSVKEHLLEDGDIQHILLWRIWCEIKNDFKEIGSTGKPGKAFQIYSKYLTPGPHYIDSIYIDDNKKKIIGDIVNKHITDVYNGLDIQPAGIDALFDDISVGISHYIDEILDSYIISNQYRIFCTRNALTQSLHLQIKLHNKH